MPFIYQNKNYWEKFGYFSSLVGDKPTKVPEPYQLMQILNTLHMISLSIKEKAAKDKRFDESDIARRLAKDVTDEFVPKIHQFYDLILKYKK